MKRRSKTKKQTAQKPQNLTKDLIEKTVSNKGSHHGVFQIQTIIHKKSDKFWILYVSDGYFKLKVAFSGDAAKQIQNKSLKVGSILQAVIITFNFEKGVFNVKDVLNIWESTSIVGSPIKWQFNKVNSNKKGSAVIDWSSEPLLSIENNSDDQSEKQIIQPEKPNRRSKSLKKDEEKNKSKNKQNTKANSKQQIQHNTKSKSKSKSKLKAKQTSKSKSKSKSKKKEQSESQQQQQQQFKSRKKSQRIAKSRKKILEQDKQLEQKPRKNSKSRQKSKKQKQRQKQKQKQKLIQKQQQEQEQEQLQEIKNKSDTKTNFSNTKNLNKNKQKPKQQIAGSNQRQSIIVSPDKKIISNYKKKSPPKNRKSRSKSHSRKKMNQVELGEPQQYTSITESSINKTKQQSYAIKKQKQTPRNREQSAIKQLLIEDRSLNNKKISQSSIKISLLSSKKESNKQQNDQQMEEVLKLFQDQQKNQHQKIIKGSKFFQQYSSNRKSKLPEIELSETNIVIRDSQQYNTDEIERLLAEDDERKRQQNQSNIKETLQQEMQQLERMLEQQQKLNSLGQGQLTKLNRMSSHKKTQLKSEKKISPNPKSVIKNNNRYENTETNVFPVSETQYISIQEIHPSIGSNWKIKLKLLCMSSTLQTNNKNPKYYAIFMDKNGQYIQASIPTKYPISHLQQQQFYQIYRADIETSALHKLKGNSYVISFVNSTVCAKIQPFYLIQKDAQMFSSLRDVQKTSRNSLNKLVNVVAIVGDVEKSIYVKNGQSKVKSTYTLIDPLSISNIALIDFNQFCQLQRLSVVVLFNLKVGSYKDSFQLNIVNNTVFKKNNKSIQMRQQIISYCTEKFLSTFVPKLDLEQISYHALKNSQQLVLKKLISEFQLRGELRGKLESYQRNRIYYLSCPTCKKKLLERFGGTYSCAKCKGTKQPLAKYLVTGDFYTNQGKIHIIYDQKLCQKIFGTKAQNLYQLQMINMRQQVYSLQKQLEKLMGKQIIVQIVGSVSLQDGKQKVNYSLKYIEMVRTQEVFDRLMVQIKSYMSAIQK